MERTRGDKDERKLRSEQGRASGGRGGSSALTVMPNYCLVFSVSMCSLICCAAH